MHFALQNSPSVRNVLSCSQQKNLTKISLDNTQLSQQKVWKWAFPGMAQVISYHPGSRLCFSFYPQWLVFHSLACYLVVPRWLPQLQEKGEEWHHHILFLHLSLFTRKQIIFFRIPQQISQSVSKETRILGQCSCKGSWKGKYPPKWNGNSLLCLAHSWSISGGYARAGHIPFGQNLCSISEEKMKATKSIFHQANILTVSLLRWRQTMLKALHWWWFMYPHQNNSQIWNKLPFSTSHHGMHGNYLPLAQNSFDLQIQCSLEKGRLFLNGICFAWLRLGP